MVQNLPSLSQLTNFFFSLYIMLCFALFPSLLTHLLFFSSQRLYFLSFPLTAALKEFQCCVVICELDCFTLLVPAVFT